MDSQTIIPRLADEVIASLGNISKNNQIVIRLISENSWTAYELSLLVGEYPDFDPHGATGDKLAENIYSRLFDLKRRHGASVINVYKKEWFACGTLADPEVRRAIAPRDALLGPIVRKGQKRRTKERSLRGLMFEILSRLGPLEQPRLVFEIKRHPDYHGMYADHIALRKAVNGTLRNNSKRHKNLLFERHDEESRLSKWGIKPAAEAPVIRTRLQVKALTAIMSRKWRIRGWFIKELAAAAIAEGSDYKLQPGATEESVASDIASHLNRHRGKIFEPAGKKGRLARWRLKPPGSLKIPSVPKDWDKIVLAVATDNDSIPTFSRLINQVRHGAMIVGFDALLAPTPLLTNQVALAVARVFGVNYLAPEIEPIPPPEEKPKTAPPRVKIIPQPRRLMGDEGLAELLEGLDLPKA